MKATDDRVRAVLEQAFAEVKRLRAENEALRAGAKEPIAIVGMGCRFPGGVTDPDSLWTLLHESIDGVREVPADRWTRPEGEAVPGALFGGFLDDVAGFDPEFFGISPREALRMDPQQRLVLEVTWEALERAGITPSSLAGTRTGTFIGLMHADYTERAMAAPPEPPPEVYTATGNGNCVAAGRLSYTLGLQGPCMVIDTACSSSLVAVHLACTSLRAGESDLALVGGVHTMLSRKTMELTALTGALSPDGRCRAFDAGANGFVRGEGCGIVVLKRLRDAVEAGDPICAVIRGSAVNHDGRTNGLTAPNYQAQADLIRDALRDAGTQPHEVGYVEAHGTGTSLGDPVECEALRSVYGTPQASDAPCWIGALKTQVGHLEAAAGVAGLIKAVLCLQHGRVTPNLHFKTLNPRIDLAGTRLAIADHEAPLPATAPQVAVSSFGLSGTNAHVVLGAAPAAPERPALCGPTVLCLSARSPDAARDLLRRYQARLRDASPAEVAEICRLASTREGFEHRLAVHAPDPAALPRVLAATTREPVRAQRRPRIGFLFTGQGAQYPGMGRELYASYPVFRESIDASHAWLVEHCNLPLRDVMFGTDAEVLERPEHVQPVIFAFQLALVALLRTCGIVADVAVGHSLGEFAAAHTAGVLGSEDGLHLVHERGRRLGELTNHGAMLVVAGSEQEVRAVLEPWPEDLLIGAVNTPAQTVLTGPTHAVAVAERAFTDPRWDAGRVRIAYASHSPLVDPVLPSFEAAVAGVELRPAELPLISGVDGRIDPARWSTTQYWRDQLRQPVRFLDAVQALLARVDVCIEIGPHPVLSAAVVACDPAMADRVAAPLRRGQPEVEALGSAAATLFENGCDFDIGALWTPRSEGRTGAATLPTYPFQHTPYLLPEPRGGGTTAIAGHGEEWMHTVQWTVDRGRDGPKAPACAWAIVGDPQGLAGRIAAALQASGAEAVRTFDDAEAAGRWSGPDGSPPAVVLAAEAAGDDSGEDLCLTLVTLFRTRADRIALVTTGGEEIDTLDRVVPRMAAARGMAIALRLEHGPRFAGAFDLSAAPTDAEVAGLARRLVGPRDAERDAALRGGNWCVPRLAPMRVTTHDALQLRDDRTYLVTGGLGGIGRAIARWLVDRGAKHLVLTSRRPVDADPERAQVVRSLRSLGATVRAEAVDVADETAMRNLVQALAHPLGGVFHTAGVASVVPSPLLGRAELASVFHAKVHGARVLDRLCRHDTLDHFVLFGSGAAVWGGAGQAHYAAANRFLDGLAQRRGAEGLPALCVDWGFWADGGMRDAALEERFTEVGIRAMDTAGALGALERALHAPASRVVVADVAWDTLSAVLESQQAHLLLADLVATASAGPGSGLLEACLEGDLVDCSDADLAVHVQRALSTEIANLLGIDPERIVSDVPLTHIGVDSLAAVKLRVSLERTLGVALPMQLLLQYPTPQELTAQLHRIVADERLKRMLAPADGAAGETREEFVL